MLAIERTLPSIFANVAKFSQHAHPGVSSIHPMTLGLKHSLRTYRDDANDDAAVAAVIELSACTQTPSTACAIKSANMKSDDRGVQLVLVNFVES